MKPKKAYKYLRKKLSHDYTKVFDSNGGYGVVDNVLAWVGKSDMVGVVIVSSILGKLPYPHQRQDREIILRFLKKNSYKDYKCHTHS